ncbi:unnamed protein product [Tenebrio molitor]|nr:unnamed protein product [Tenebrio molitor]
MSCHTTLVFLCTASCPQEKNHTDFNPVTKLATK